MMLRSRGICSLFLQSGKLQIPPRAIGLASQSNHLVGMTVCMRAQTSTGSAGRSGIGGNFSRSGLRPAITVCTEKDDAWWEEETKFFDTRRSRAWVMTRRLCHTSHHRGQQMAMLRMLGRSLHSSYGPTADTGGLMQQHAPTIYAYPDLDALLDGESSGGRKASLPRAGGKKVTERG
jgi:hypothetical protein